MTKYEMQLVIGALRHKARDEAGCSQAPDLIDKRDTQEWKLADKLEARANHIGHIDPEKDRLATEIAKGSGFI